MTRSRALVQRPGRRIHWASLGPGETAWIGVGCSLDVPVFGITEHGRDWAAWLALATDPTSNLCSRCRTPLLAAALALGEIEEIRGLAADREALMLEVRALRAERTKWTTAALEETRAASRHRWER